MGHVRRQTDTFGGGTCEKTDGHGRGREGGHVRRQADVGGGGWRREGGGTCEETDGHFGGGHVRRQTDMGEGGRGDL